MTDVPRATSDSDLQAAWRDGARALREGRPAEALGLFQKITEASQPPPSVWIGVAMAHRALADRTEELAALQQALNLDPRDIRVLIMVADNHAAAGDARAAGAYYATAVKIAGTTRILDRALEAEVARAQQMLEQYAADYGAHLRSELGTELLAKPQARRMSRALDLMLGKTELYLQKPTSFYFPELPNIEYADRSEFPWLDKVEAATDAIRAELMGVLEEDAAFAPYVEADPNRPFFDGHGMLGNPDWSAFYLWKAGAPVPENVARFPATMAALEGAPLCRVPGRTPSILFSLLRPGAHIPPHHGFMNARYICHLPLIVPEGCAMRVGSETRAWSEGRACVFDDSIEHEAWNRNPEHLRVVMIFDIWRPELTGPERDMISTVLQAVDAYGMGAPADATL